MAEKMVVTSLNWVMGDWVTGSDAAFLSQLKPVLAELRRKNVAVIGFSDRDRAEIEPLRTALNWSDPFVVESGSAIFTPVDHNPFSVPMGEQDGAYFVAEFGCPYVQSRAGLRVLANLISHPLKGFGDFTVPQLERFLKISEEVAHRAKAREFSEPFMTPKAVETDVLVKAAKEMGFEIVLRDPETTRFSELVGGGASVSEAIAQIISAYKQDNAAASVVVLGTEADRQSVLSATETVNDWAAVIVRSQDEWLAQLKHL